MTDTSNHPDAFAANVERFTGFADTYDRYRPTPPAVLVAALKRLARAARPDMVVDLGCGTGLSTRVWADHARRVIGIEPSDDMRRRAEANTASPDVSYAPGLSHATGLDDGCADIVTCSQSLHWMDPPGTFAESARILRPGGVFAAYDCDWPPTTSDWRADAAYSQFMEHIGTLERIHGLTDGLKKWDKAGHLQRMRDSGRFRHVRELLLHGEETGNAERLFGVAMSQGKIAGLLKLGLTSDRIGLDAFKARVDELLGEEFAGWLFCYRVRIGIV